MYFSFMKTCISIFRLAVKTTNACSVSRFPIHQYYSVNSSKNMVCVSQWKDSQTSINKLSANKIWKGIFYIFNCKKSYFL